MQNGAFKFSGKWQSKVRSLPETGMGYVVVSVTLNDGRRFNQAVIDTGIMARVRGLPDIPFTEDEIADLVATHEKWDWKQKP